jgi:nucleoside-diphosphate-sugar epimerase
MLAALKFAQEGKGMRVFLTGAGGYVGTTLTRRLVRAGHQVVGLVRSETAADAVLEAGGEPRRGTLSDTDVLEAEASVADAVVHAAVSIDDRARLDASAVDALLSGLRQQTRRPRFVYTSNTQVYPDTGDGAAREDAADRASAVQPYKLDGEILATSVPGLHAVAVRAPVIYGGRPSRMIEALRADAVARGFAPYLGSGTNRISTVHVEDLAGLYAAILAADPPPGAVYNAGSAEPVSLRAFAEGVGRSVGVPARSLTPEEAGGVGANTAVVTRANVVDSARAYRELGWNPHRPSLVDYLDSLGRKYEEAASQPVPGRATP